MLYIYISLGESRDGGMDWAVGMGLSFLKAWVFEISR